MHARGLVGGGSRPRRPQQNTKRGLVLGFKQGPGRGKVQSKNYLMPHNTHACAQKSEAKACNTSRRGCTAPLFALGGGLDSVGLLVVVAR